MMQRQSTGWQGKAGPRTLAMRWKWENWHLSGSAADLLLFSLFSATRLCGTGTIISSNGCGKRQALVSYTEEFTYKILCQKQLQDLNVQHCMRNITSKKICYCYSAVLHFPEHKQYLSRTFFVGRGMGKNVRQRVTAWQANNSKFSKVIKIKQDTERTLYISCKIFQLLHSSSKSEWSSLK